MNLRRLITKGVSECAGLLSTPTAKQPGLRILNYHSVGGSALDDRKGYFSISLSRFVEHIELLAEQSNWQLTPLQSASNCPDKLYVALSFDDGYLDNLRLAAPVLLERGVPFTVFVVTELVKARRQGFLSPEDLKELAGLPGVKIGSHGKTHRPLSLCTAAELKTELTDSKMYLDDLLGVETTAVAYPFGAANRQVRDEASHCGYILGACTRYGINPPDRDSLMLFRYNIESDNNSRILRQKLLGHWDWYRLRSPDPLLSNP